MSPAGSGPALTRAYVLGVGLARPSLQETLLRLEELVYGTVRAALDDAGVSQRELDHLTIGACDELDGRPISSMLMAAPSGGYLTDELKVTDSGLNALCLEVARIGTGEFHLGLVSSWCKSSKTEFETVMSLRCDPFFSRPLGIGGVVGDALLAQAAARRFGVTERAAAEAVVAAHERAARNPRGLQRDVPTVEEILASDYEATPLRRGHRAKRTDGAVALVIASETFVRKHPDCIPLARIAGVGWCSDSYRLDAARLGSFQSAELAWNQAMQHSDWDGEALDVAEIEVPTGYHQTAYREVFRLGGETDVSPSGGSAAQYPVFCAGLVNAAEAVLQVSGRAGAAQRVGAHRAAAHGCHGTAQQGHVVALFEAVSR